MKNPNATIHQTAEVQSSKIGKGSVVWQFCVVLGGARIGEDCNVNSHCFIENDVVVGNRVTIKSGVQLWDGVRVEDDVFIGPNTTFCNDPFPRSKQRLEGFSPVILKAGCSVGANVTLLPGVTVGAGSMIGAGSVVTRDVPENELWLGNPARFVRRLVPPEQLDASV
jgi:UDP-2-acetamido-3-amino-2,3-dideoxy-glucuronate N-acetyltransferase